ncbi:MAG: DUF3054 domain-containing protein [Streptosporangiaceae bacterium]
MRKGWALGLDLLCVVVFVAIGRRNHGESSELAGLAITAWPFVTALAVGWLAATAWKRPLAGIPAGICLWLVTVTVGMLLRAASDQGTAPSFVIVALTFLGLALLGWRSLAALIGKRA